MKPRLVAASLLAVIGMTAIGVWIESPLPADLFRRASAALVLLDRDGRELRTTRAADGSRRRWLSLSEMDPDLIAGFIAAEDQRFFTHYGVDPRAVVRALRDNLRARRIVSGGSTITMQLARILQPAGRDWLGKFQQSLWALRLERNLDKQEILEQYLNRVPLGQGTIGVSAASALYFNASAEELSLGQAAILAGLARAPSIDNPLVAPGRAAERRTYVLARLATLGYAAADNVARAAAEPARASGGKSVFLAPHFTTQLLSWAERRGTGAVGTWRTSLDLGLQLELEAEVRHTVETLSDRGARHAAAVVLDNPTGEILAWVGSPDFWADTAGQVDMVISPRQPGSALKPFLYALAFDRGYTPASILPDIATVYQTSTGAYSPRNYDRRFHGPVRAREALGSSYNIPAVELANRLGVGSLLHTLRNAGFASLGRNAEFYGLGLALGNGDVTLLELANGYRALANGGEWTSTRWLVGSPGDPAEPGTRIASKPATAMVLDILDDPLARAPGFGIETALDFPFPVAAKTGTSRHFTDNWAIGTSGRFTVAVWVGNFSGRPMNGVSGVTGAGPLLHRAVLATARRYPPGSLLSPESTGAIPLNVCRLSGLLATQECPGTIEWFAPGTAPARSCDWHRRGNVLLPLRYADWAQASQVSLVAQPVLARPPTEEDEDPRLRILSPRDGDIYRIPPGVDPRYASVPLRAAGGRGGNEVRWFVDGRRYRAARWSLRPGTHVVRAVSSAGDTAQVSIRVESPELN